MGKLELAVLRSRQQVTVSCHPNFTNYTNDQLLLAAEGFFTAVGNADWDDGLGCGTCVKLEYQGNTVTVNVVDRCEQAVKVSSDADSVFRCWSCTKGWFDLGGPAWRTLTGGAPPGHVHGVKSTWVTCPGDLARGNIQVYVKPGSDPWDARFQVK